MTEMTAIRLNQLKKATEAYKELKVLHTDPVTEELSEDFPAWSVFRDGFIADWTSNRIIVDEKEADAMFDKTAEEALAQIEAAEGNTVELVVVETINPPVITLKVKDVPAVKRRGRPPGKTVPGARSYLPATEKVLRKLKQAKTKAKAKKATKKEGPSKMDLARATVEKFAAKGWSRKDILARLVKQNGLSPAYAATAYQKLA